MKKFIVTKKQLDEYIETKKAELVFFDIIEAMYKNKKYLSENISQKKANQTIINDYYRKNLITPKVEELLIKYDIMNNKHKII